MKVALNPNGKAKTMTHDQLEQQMLNVCQRLDAFMETFGPRLAVVVDSQERIERQLAKLDGDMTLVHTAVKGIQSAIVGLDEAEGALERLENRRSRVRRKR